MDRAEAKTAAIEALRARGAADPEAAAHFIEARLSSDPDVMAELASTMDLGILEERASGESAVKILRGEYDGSQEREELMGRAKAIQSYTPLSEQYADQLQGDADASGFTGNIVNRGRVAV